MALEGTLKDFSLADIFQLIGLQRKTGVLTLRGKDDTVTVTFLDGKVVSADSLNRRLENRLGHVLIRTGTLTTDQLNRALEIQRETLQRLGFILVHYEIISQDSLRQALQLQILQIIFRLFRWKDGEYHFSQETTIEYDRENVVPITAESILMEGARMIDEWPIIEKKVRSYDMVFARRELEEGSSITHAADNEEMDDTESRRRKTEQKGQIVVSGQEKAIYELVDGKRTVGEIVEVSRFSEFDTNKALYELAVLGLIEERREPIAVVEEEPVATEEVVYESVPPVVPLPLVIGLALIALLSLATSWKNPLNLLSQRGKETTSVRDARKSVSFQRIRTIGEAIESYELIHDDLPGDLNQLVPTYIGPEILHDPWGREYRYLQRPDRYLIIGFTPDGRPDTDLFYTHSLNGTVPGPPAGTSPTGRITLVD